MTPSGKVVDTAPAYGDSEAVIGSILGESENVADGLRRLLFLATKVDREDAPDGRAWLADSFRALRTRHLDLVQPHKLSGVARLLPLAADRGMAVLVNLPFGRGAQFRAVGDRPLPDWAAEIDCSSWAQVFLKYVVAHPAVNCAIPGTTQPRHAEDNLGAARGRLPDAAMRRNIERWFDAITDG